MESELLADKEKNLSSVSLREYQWEDLRRARDAGGYPWTHLLKPPLQGKITAEDIIRETTPRRSMSREFSKSRTHSPVSDTQRILNLDSSPGSSRKYGEEGEDEGVHIPNFSKEVSLDEDDVSANEPLKSGLIGIPESPTNIHLITPVELPTINVSPKGILKRRLPEKQYIGVTETREKTKCCHPLVNKIKHLADKTLHKLDRNDIEKSPLSKRKKNEEIQEIRQLKSSPGAVRRQKFSAIKLGSSDEMSKSMCTDTPPPRKKKEHIYEDIEESKNDEEKLYIFSSAIDNENIAKAKCDSKNNNKKEKESILENKSNISRDPSLVMEKDFLNSGKLYKGDNTKKVVDLLDEEADQDEPNVDEIFENQLQEIEQKRESPNITITEITDDDTEVHADLNHSAVVPIETSPSPSPLNIGKRKDIESVEQPWSKPSSDHEYEIIEKPLPNIDYNLQNPSEKTMLVKTDDELSSTTSLERKYLQHTSDEEEQTYDKDNTRDDSNEAIINAKILQKDIEDRFFVNTPSTVSRTECEVSTSQVDSSALEQLPLKRDSRAKNSDGNEKNLHQRFKDSTGKLKTQAGKLKTKLQNIKSNKLAKSERPKTDTGERSKFKMPERPKFSLPERPKFTLPDRRKFSLPDGPKFKKFTLPERPKLSVPEFPKFKIPERPKLNFPNLRRKKEYKIDTDTSASVSDLKQAATVEFEVKTYPRLFNRKKKTDLQKTSSSPTLNREETPPPTFTFKQFKQCKEDPTPYMPDSPEQPREYGTVDNGDINFENEMSRSHFETTYDFDKIDTGYMDDESEVSQFDDKKSEPNVSLSKQEYTHVITEINNDEFFVRPRGISREDIQVREYLNDETRQAFKNPKNILALMGKNFEVKNNNTYMNDPEDNPEHEVDDNEPMRYSNEDLNDRDDGYYTFPPVRPSRAKRQKKELEMTTYVDESNHASMQFSEVDLSVPEDMKQLEEEHIKDVTNFNLSNIETNLEFVPLTDLHSTHEYANDDIIQYPENVPLHSQTLPMPPKRKKKFGKKDFPHSSLNDFNNVASAKSWEELEKQHTEDIIVYRTEHEYISPSVENAVIDQSPLPPRRNRSRSSRGTSLCDDDRTSHGAESLTLDTHVQPADDIDSERDMRQESPGYATVDKASYLPRKGTRRSLSQTPPIRRKSNSSERKYYTVGTNKESPDRPPRKKSSTSLMTLDSFTKHSVSGDLTQYVEIDEPLEAQKHLNSGDIVNKMKDRPLPPPPRPPRGSRRRKNKNNDLEEQETNEVDKKIESHLETEQSEYQQNVMEIEVSTQTDPLPDDVDFDLGIDDNLDISMSSSLRDIVDDDSLLTKNNTKVTENSRISRPASLSEKSFKLSDPKISELSKPNIGRTSPTVILVEKRVSSPTRINEREEMLTEASLTVQHIDVDKSQIPDVPPLPKSRGVPSASQNSKTTVLPGEERALERIIDASRDVQLDNLVTQRLQVRDLDVGRLNVSELQANKILVSDIEGMTLQVTELDSKSGHISVSGIEFSQSVIDEIVKKFAEISTSNSSLQPEAQRHVSREEQTQTDDFGEKNTETKLTIEEEVLQITPVSADEGTTPPERPPPPDLTPLLYSYLQDITIPPASFYPTRSFRERPFTEFHESQHQTPPTPSRRTKRKPPTPHSESSSEEGRLRPSPRRMPSTVRAQEPTIVEAGAQFLRVCQNSISRTIRNIFNSFMAYVSGTEDKKDVQMALVIFLVLIAGLLMFGLSDSKTIHHHHWEFFNPANGNH